MSLSPIPFLPGRGAYPAFPLGRFLPPILPGVVTAWLENNVPPGAWVLDPFGASPQAAIEAARAGYKVVIAANNPVTRFLVEMAADLPQASELQASLSELAAAYKGNERIEPHIRSLYTSECTECRTQLEVDAFLWERGATGPYGKLVKCPQCGAEGEQSANQADLDRAAHFATGGLHHARAVERVAPPDDPDRQHAEEALSTYLPRAVYILFTLINKLDGLTISPQRRRCLQALLLLACDRANALWAYPTVRERPRALSVPPRYRERNIWLALEDAANSWARKPGEEQLPLVVWPETAPPGGISLFEGRLRELSQSLIALPVGGVLAALPRPNQAFWSLSALWAGWLWGREAAASIKSVLRRRRYDWAWHTTALQAAFQHLYPALPPKIPCFGLTGEAEPGFLTAALTAADSAGFDLRGLALRLEDEQAQITWERESTFPSNTAISSPEVLVGEAVRQYLEARGEPARYLPVYTAGLQELAAGRFFRISSVIPHETPGSDSGQSSLEAAAHDETHSSEEAGKTTTSNVSPVDQFNQVVGILRETLSYRGGFLRYGASEAAETGQFWPRYPQNPQLPLADRVEMALVSYLLRQAGSSLDELQIHLYRSFPGLFTPDPELVQVCLESYAEQQTDAGIGWKMRSQDAPVTRRADLQASQLLLIQLGERLGYRSLQPESDEGKYKNPIVWMDRYGETRYRFYTIASAVLGEIILESDVPPAESLVVLPGGRANLVAYKLQRDPRLGSVCEPNPNGWRFLKFRHLRWLIESPLTSRENFDEQLRLDPLTFTTPQMRLF